LIETKLRPIIDEYLTATALITQKTQRSKIGQVIRTHTPHRGNTLEKNMTPNSMQT